MINPGATWTVGIEFVLEIARLTTKRAIFRNEEGNEVEVNRLTWEMMGRPVSIAVAPVLID